MAQFVVRPAGVDDIPEMTDVFVDSFSRNAEFEAMNRNVSRADQLEHNAKWFKESMEWPGRRFFKAVEVETGKIVGLSQWWYPHTLTPEQIAEGIGQDKLPETWPPGTEVGLSTNFMGKIFETRKKNLKPEKEYFVNLLAVRLDYQRKGLGTLLLEDGLLAADRDGARTYIEASAYGFPLYKKYGWVDFDEIVVDTAPYGGKGIERTMLMWREPQPLKN